MYKRQILGSTIPRYSYGINLSAAYGGFDVSVLLQGVGGVSGRLDGYVGYAFNNTGSVQRWQMEGRWSPDNPNPNATYPRMEFITNSGTNNTLSSSFWILNGAYLKLRNVQLGYRVPAPLTRRMGLQGVRVYASGENLLTWSNYRKGWDPQINTGGVYYPILANYTPVLNINF